MRIITSTLDQISGLDILASGLLVFFFILFLWIVYRIVRTSKKDSEKWAKLPLEDNLSKDINLHKKSI
jgi:cbb3-type cytochrome oxidase subunit 3